MRFAVFPSKDLILLGSSKPGNSIKILLLPLLIIVGSLVPTSSTLLLKLQGGPCLLQANEHLQAMNLQFHTNEWTTSANTQIKV